MTLSVQPALKTSYTERGNEYKESNIGKYAAGAGAIGTTAFYGGKYAYNTAKEIYPKAKVLKMNLSGILGNAFKPQIKKNVTVNFGENGASIIVNTEKVNRATEFIAENAKKINKENIKKAGKSVVDFVKSNAKKVNKANIKKAGKSVVDFVKSNTKKVNMTNIKKAVQPAIDFAKKPSVKYGAGVAAGIIGVVALGFVADAIANKISQYKADHQNILLKKIRH